MTAGSGGGLPPPSLGAERIARALDPKAKRQGRHWLARCPCHDDSHASLEVIDKNGRTLWICRAGCDQGDVTVELRRRGLIGRNGSAGDPQTKPREKAAYQGDDWRPILPVPEGAPDPAFSHPIYGKATATWAYRNAGGRTLFHVARFDPPGERKQILPRCWGTLNGKSGWHWRHPAPPRPLYGLDRLATRPEALVIVCEGEKTADAAAELLPDHVAITWPSGAAATGSADWSPLKGRKVWIWPDHDEPGRKAAEAIGDTLLEISEKVMMVDVPADLPPGWDLADPMPEGLDPGEILDHAERHVPAIDRLIERAGDDPGAPFEGEAIDFLAALRGRDPAAYERARARLKKAHVRVAALDQEIERRTPETSAETGQGRSLNLPDPAPWDHPVVGAELIAELIASLKRFVVLPDHAAVAVCLWALHCHAHPAAFHSPRLAITSPVMRCGKSSLLRWLARIVPRPLPTSNISPAAVYRVIEAAHPVLLVDELDQVDKEKKVELVGLINSSHCVLDAQIIRNVGDQHEPRAFSTWSPMALAAIGRLPPQWVDRSVVIEMSRKLVGDRAEGMRLDRDQGFETLRRKAARWATNYLETLRGADPEMPPGLNDRQRDDWRLMLGIADLIGDGWPAKARAAAAALSAADDDSEAYGIQALADIRQVFDDRGEPDSLSSDSIVSALIQIEGRPWAEYRRDGKPLTKNALARLLKAFAIAPGTIRIGSDTPKGYRRDQFAEAWERYLLDETLFQTATPPQPRESATHSDFQTATPEPDVADWNRENPRQSAACGGVADGIRETPPEDVCELPWQDDPAEQHNWNPADHEPICCHCGAPIRVNEDRIARDDGQLIHPACFAAGFTSSRVKWT